MKKKLIYLLLLSFSIPTVHTYATELDNTVIEQDVNTYDNEIVYSETVQEVTGRSVLRSSRILLGHSDDIRKNSCNYSWTFINTITGSCKVTLQKLSSNGSWVDTSYSITNSFTKMGDFDGHLSVSNLSGTYRLKYAFTSPYSETVYSGSTVIN